MGPGLTYTYTGTLGSPYTGAFGSWWVGGGWTTVTGSPPATGTWPETTTTWSNIQEYMIQRPDQTYTLYKIQSMCVGVRVYVYTGP